ncbi:MAG: hypothetical protein HUJ63_09070, partial [Enterococcus sp.]|nr:hypothetical protein [Enterococcus sp.]
MEDTTFSVLPEDKSDPFSAYAAYHAAKAQGYQFGQPEFSGMAGGPFDTDPFASLHTTGDGMGTSNVVNGLVLADGSWVDRETLSKTPQGRRLIRDEEDVRRGHKRNFLDTMADTRLTDFIPFLGMYARVGTDLSDAKDVMDFYDARMAGKPTTFDQALKATLYERENALNSDGTTGAMFASILRQAPALCFEFGIWNLASGAVRGAAVSGIVKSATDEAAVAASRYALSRAVKIGADETAEAAARLAVRGMVAAGAEATEAAAARALLSPSSALYGKVLETVEAQTGLLVTGAANAVAKPATWAPGLAGKVAHIRADSALRSALSRMSSDSAVGRAWAGLLKSTRDAAVEGLLDAGAWGSEASTVLTSGFTSAKAAAMKGFLDLTVGAAAKGGAMFIPRTVITETLGGVFGFESANELSLKSAAYNNGDQDLYDKAWGMGMFMDLLEYVSENTGRGFNNLFRAGALKFAPGLAKPAVSTFGREATAKVTRNAAGEATDIVFNGFIDQASHAEAGGVIRRFCERAFGGRSLKDNVAADRFRAVASKLDGKGVAYTETALSRALENGTTAGLPQDLARELGTDVAGYARQAVKEFNRTGLERLKTKGYMRFVVADWMARHNFDPMTAFDAFTALGYDGVVGEMLEERYSDVVTGLFGMDAKRDHTFAGRLKAAVQGALLLNEDWSWNVKQLVAEAAGFAVPGIVRMASMRAIAALGSESAYTRMADRGSLYMDVARTGSAMQWRLGAFLDNADARIARLESRAADAEASVRDAEARASSPAAEVVVTPAEVDSLRAGAAVARRAVERAKDLKQSLFDSLAPTLERVTGVRPGERAAPEAYLASLSDAERGRALDATVNEQIVTDRELEAPEEEYNLRVRGTSDQTRQALGAYAELVDGAGEQAQMLYKGRNRDEKTEGKSWFRRAARYAVRLFGTLATGDLGFLSVNPARWANVDRGMPDDIPDVLERGYAASFQKHLARIQAERASAEFNPLDPKAGLNPSMSDYDAAHAAALEEFSPVASDVMAKALGGHHVRMFSRDELTDVALAMVAEDQGYVRSGNGRFMKPGTEERPTYAEFMARPGVRDSVDRYVRESSTELYNLVVGGVRSGLSATEDGAVTATSILTIPKGLPTERQALVMKLIENVPSLRDAVVSVEADGSKTATDLLGGLRVRSDTVSAVSRLLLGEGAEAPVDEEDAQRVRNAANDPNVVPPELLTSVADSLHIPYDMSADSLKERNNAVADIVMQLAAAPVDGRIVTFARPSTPGERDERFGFGNNVFRPAGVVNGMWTVVLPRKDSKDAATVTADTYDGLVEKAARPEFGFAPVRSEYVFSAAETIKASDPVSMILALGAGPAYRARMEQAASAHGNEFLDPYVRRKDDGSFECDSEDRADLVRAREKSFSDMYERAAKQDDWRLYLRPGESPDDAAAARRAEALLAECRRCYGIRNTRDSEGRPIGYIAVADGLLKEMGVSLPGESVFGQSGPALRDRYVVSLRALRGVGATANTYITVNHGMAQDYASAVLDASLLGAYAGNRQLAHGPSYAKHLSDFMEEADRVMKEHADAVRPTDGTLAEKIDALRVDTVVGAGERRMSPRTFATFVSAFCLFRTEVAAERLQSVLGSHGAALAAVAGRIRQLPSYVVFTGLADRIVGGTGFETELGADGSSVDRPGLARLYQAFKPENGKGTLSEAIAAAVPGRDFGAFVDKVCSNLAMADRQAVRDAADAPSVTAAFKAVRAAARASGRTPAEVVAQATEKGGEAAEAVPQPGPVEAPPEPAPARPEAAPAPRPPAPTVEAPADSVPTPTGGLEGTVRPDTVVVQEDEFEEFEEESFDVPPTAQEQTSFDVTPEGERSDPPKAASVPDLTPREARVFAAVVAKIASLSAMRQEVVTDRHFADVIDRLAPGMRRVDRKMVAEAFKTLKSDDGAGAWTWGADSDEEGMTPDGYEGGNQRSLHMLRSRAVSDLLTILNVVSPTSGRDLQPFVADLRSSIDSSSWLVPNGSSALKAAFKFLDQIVNPRRYDPPKGTGGAAARNSVWHHRMGFFDKDSPMNAKVADSVKAFMGG